MRMGLAGGSYKERSLPFDAQRSINLYPAIDETQQGKEVSALYGTAGLLEFCTIPDSPIRGVFGSAQGRAFAVAGVGLYEIDSSGVATLLGSLNSNEGAVTFDENFTQLGICDGDDLYILTYATNAFAQVTDVDLPSVGTVTQQDQYFICNKNDSGEFYISAIADGTSWSSLGFATAESSPDNLVRVYSGYGQLWLFGEQSTEVWYNSGNVDFPFERVEGAKMQTGCVARFSVVDLDNSIFWLGQDRDGRGIVYAASNYSPQRVSTFAIEYAIRQATSMEDIIGYSYQEDGHLFYVLTGGGLASTLVFDASTRMWHEKASLNSNGVQGQHLAASHMFVFGKHLVGDYSSGKVYEQSLDYYDDNGQEIRRERVLSHIYNEGKRFRVNEIQIDFEYGVGLSTGQGESPTCLLQLSGDGAITWGNELSASIGAQGNYKSRAVWRRLGIYDFLTAKIVITDPVKVAICGAYLR